MSSLAIRVRGLGKQYHIGGKQQAYRTMRDLIANAVSASFRHGSDKTETKRHGKNNDWFWALRDVSFDVNQGQVIGVIGRNGAGKSTLLKILSRITDPSEGEAVVHGRVGSLLEVGTGFHPELTGRENLFMNGAILGMKKAEIERKYDEIAAFAEVERFMDTPVKHYSSGMRLRLGFSVAAHLQTEILFVDEVLAVGDIGFQRRCLGRMHQISKEGRAVLLVSHNLAAIESLCETTLVLENGLLRFMGPTREAIRLYTSESVSTAAAVDLETHERRKRSSKHAMLSALRLLNPDGSEASTFSMGSDLVFEIEVKPSMVLHSAYIGICVNGLTGQRLCTFNSRQQHADEIRIEGRTTIRCRWHDCLLLPGRYSIEVWVKQSGELLDAVREAISFDVIESDIHGTGRVQASIGVFEGRASWEVKSPEAS